jgi:hypothetical protein
MSTSNEVRESAQSAASGSPRPEQLRKLRKLADECGETFAYPQAEAEADAEIARLEGRPVSSGLDRWFDRVAVRRDVSRAGRDAASVRDSEISGHGSSAHWKVGAR